MNTIDARVTCSYQVWGFRGEGIHSAGPQRVSLEAARADVIVAESDGFSDCWIEEEICIKREVQ